MMYLLLSPVKSKFIQKELKVKKLLLLVFVFEKKKIQETETTNAPHLWHINIIIDTVECHCHRPKFD